MRSKVRRRLAVAVVVVLVVLAGLDQGGRLFAQSRSAHRVRCELSAADASVSMSAPFFGYQVARRRIGHVVTQISRVRNSGADVDILSDLHGVHVTSDQSVVHADSGQVTVTVPYSSLSVSAGPGITASRSGSDLAFASSNGAAGVFSVVIIARVVITDGNVLVVTPYRATSGGKPTSFAAIAQEARKEGQSLAPRRVALPPLLTDLGLGAPAVTDAGLILHAGGRHLTLHIPQRAGC